MYRVKIERSQLEVNHLLRSLDPASRLKLVLDFFHLVAGDGFVGRTGWGAAVADICHQVNFQIAAGAIFLGLQLVRRDV